MRISRLKLSAALLLCLEVLTPLKATDLIETDTQKAKLINAIVCHENSVKPQSLKNFLSLLFVEKECDAPILEAVYEQTLQPSQQQAIEFLSYLKQKENGWPGFMHIARCIWYGIDPSKFNIPSLSPDQNDALKLIANKVIDRNGNLRQKLDLRNMNLNTLPRILACLNDLTEINLSRNHLTNLSVLGNLTNLTKLKLHKNQITSLRGLENLTNLTKLDLSENNLSDLSILKNFPNLTKLNLRNNQIISLKGLENLIHLKQLYLSDNKINDFSPIKDLNIDILSTSRNPALDAEN